MKQELSLIAGLIKKINLIITSKIIFSKIPLNDCFMKHSKNNRTFLIFFSASIQLFLLVQLSGYSQSVSGEKKMVSELTRIEIWELGIEGLTNKIIEGLHDEYQKVEAIHSWLISNVSYSEISKKDEKHYEAIVNPLYAFMFGETVCLGYSNLFKKMADYAGLESHVVDGYAIPEDDPGYIIGNQFLAANHAWNIVKVRGKWYHIDLTWDSSVFYDEEGDIEFLMEPGTILMDRLPAASMFQLVSNPMPIEVFLNDSLRNKFDSRNGGYQFADSISYYSNLNPLDKLLMINRQYYESNSMYFGSYSYYLKISADRKYQMSKWQYGDEQYDLLKEARNLYCDALRIGPKVVIIKDATGLNFEVENSLFHKVRKSSIRGIKQIDRQLKMLSRNISAHLH